ncbi:MAG: hypothetical protein HZB67_04265 [Candidatus Aenigmarchaeota archaeon]|nr:hypothetical protein [Candidatus Aenigmarchaeota archaeon]
MDEEKFQLIWNILKVLEKHNSEDPEVVECCLDIIDQWSNDFDAEQKAKILNDFVHFRMKKRYDKDIFEEENNRQNMKNFLGSSGWVF